MWSRRAFLFFQRIRSAAQFAAADARRVSTTGPSISFSGSKSYGQFNYGSAWRKHPWDFMLGIMLSGPVAIYLSFSRNPVSAQDVSEADLVTENDEAQAYVTGLRRIEDGSVISNSHTSRWRIFTDHGRDLFLKARISSSPTSIFRCFYCRRNVDELGVSMGHSPAHNLVSQAFLLGLTQSLAPLSVRPDLEFLASGTISL